MRYSAEQIQFLRDRFPLLLVPELTEAFNDRFGMNKTPGQIRSTLKNHRIRCGRPVGSQPGTLRLVTREQAEFIRQEYPNHSRKELTRLVNEKFNTTLKTSQLASFVKNHNIDSGRDGRFKAGHESWNKGTKGLTTANRTSFKPGGVPANTKPIGHERICPKDGYILIKIAERNPYTGAPTRYKHKHVVIWESENGPAPKGHVIKFLDGDKTNCEIDNLILLSRAENCYLNKNGYNDLPEELKPSFRALAKLIAATKRASRREVA